MLTEVQVLRLIADCGQEAVAEALGISKSEVSRKISGKAGWSIEQFCKLPDVLDIEAKVKGAKNDNEDYVRALETVVRHKLNEE